MLVGWTAATVLVLVKVPSPAATVGVIILPGWLFAALLVRAGWMGAMPTPTGVRVRNLLRTTDIAWPQVERFSLGQTQMLPAVGRVHLVDGSVVPISGIQPRNILFFPGDESAGELIKRLNAELAERR